MAYVFFFAFMFLSLFSKAALVRVQFLLFVLESQFLFNYFQSASVHVHFLLLALESHFHFLARPLVYHWAIRMFMCIEYLNVLF